MDIEDAFTEEAILHYDTNVGGEEETALEEVLKRVYQSNNINWSPDIMKVAMLAFVAGRTYQSEQIDVNNFPIVMNVAMVQEFLEFLVAKGAT